LSYCAFVREGRAHSTLVARRERQHPAEFGRAATYVETVDAPAIEALSERFLKAIDYSGLVEVEYKQDPRDGLYKLLDVNIRTWGFHILGIPAGVDFPYLLFADQLDLPTTGSRSAAGIGWLRLVTDVPTAVAQMARRQISIGGYLTSLARTRIESVFSMDDPLPFFAELGILPYVAIRDAAGRRGNTGAPRAPLPER
jgi:predicted ATP-grasp superfamily ATP-dependent carboligase